MALVKDYFDKTTLYQNEYGKKTIVLMQVGAFFEVYGIENKDLNSIHGSEIVEFSNICDLNIADKKICIGKDNIIMAGFSHYTIDKYIKKLQEAGYTIVVYTQDEQTKNTTRSLAGIYSPGTYFSQDSNQITNNTTCIWVNVIDSSTLFLKKKSGQNKHMYVGLANIDIYTGKTSIFEFNETYINNPTTFDELERFISIYNPSEVIIIANISDKEINDIISYANIHASSIHKINLLNDMKNESYKRALNSEKQKYQKEILEKFFKINDFELFNQHFYEYAIAAQSFCFLLDFIYQHNPNLVNKITPPIFENCSDRLILANHSLKQLNIINDSSLSNNNGKFSSVEKLLNSCVTSMGKRRFSYQFLNPTTNIEYLNSEYNITDHILNNYPNNQILKSKLMNIKDISKINRQIIMKKISPKSLFQFYKNLHIIKDIFQLLHTDIELMNYLNKKNSYCENINNYCNNLIQFFESHFNIEMCKEIDSIQSFERNFINSGLDDELDANMQLLTESINKLESIRNYFNNCISTTEKGTDFIKLHETEKNSLSLIATKRRCNVLKEYMNKLSDKKNILLEYSVNNNIQSFELSYSIEFHTQSASNNSISNIQINECCKNITNIKLKMKDIITRIYFNVIEKLESPDIQLQFETIIEFITIIDVIFCKAYIAQKYNYCKPTIQIDATKSFVDVKDLRHCLIEKIQENELYVANDISLGNDIINGILLYGTNAVGKTSFIRALGIAVIMAQSGLYVPASSFHFHPYKYIFTRILGNDNIFKGLSTFAVEMSELRTILRLGDNKSLILGDELCSGTESISATSIFIAGIQQLYKKSSSFIFATHLHEIVHYDELKEMKSVVLKHMSIIYDREKDIIIYDRKLKDGPGDNMYGLEVCKSLNLPRDFLEMANNIRMKYNPESGSILSLKTSHFNSEKIMGRCEICKIEMGSEVHHLQHQNISDSNGFIESFHKNHNANLATLCEKCHYLIHKEDKMHKRVKTSKGYDIIPIL